jgi:hypothetical protein
MQLFIVHHWRVSPDAFGKRKYNTIYLPVRPRGFAATIGNRKEQHNQSIENKEKVKIDSVGPRARGRYWKAESGH